MRHKKRYVQIKKTINVENQHREEQIRMNFEKELEKKEKRLKNKGQYWV